ncbi:Ca2 :Cation Antiporter (CaCA) Family [Phytophthora cinnamomi]|uniref:Ca2:Cation Antiporter (CaCA) Family n=1 Tax=Phytophthora cinnamomi TaxID=4785 RepID=UPI003559F4F7|nr:Ca2 :Cation Antiporter (CaCA) Family [Phytophthora cinnamomi]
MGLVAPLPAACDAYPFVANMTLGPLGFDYVHLHYCSLSDLPLLSFSLLFLWLAALFYFLGTTADGYFSPTLASLSDRLRVPHDVAGITFLAFGNGAPDVFSAIAAYSSGVGETGVNELLGGAMFVSTVVVGGVAVASAVKVQRWAFVRDVGALIGSLLLFLLLAMSSSGRDVGDTAVAALMFLLMYGIYVGSVVFPACVARGKNATRMRQTDLRGHEYAFITRSEAGVDSEKMNDESRETDAGKPVEPKEFEMSSPRELAGPRFSSRVFDDHFDVEEEDSLSSPLIADDCRTNYRCGKLSRSSAAV